MYCVVSLKLGISMFYSCLLNRQDACARARAQGRGRAVAVCPRPNRALHATRTQYQTTSAYI